MLSILEGYKTLVTCVTGAAGVCTGWVYLDMPQPALKSYVLAQSYEIKKETQGIKHGLIDLQLQMNASQRSSLRSERTSRQIELESKPEQKFKIQQSIEEIEESLDEANKQRERLLKAKEAIQ